MAVWPISRQEDESSLALQEDAAARLRALALASFIVEAPAGAGKTELLTQRFLRLLSVVNAPEEVLALTFTNKAATEMRDRILENLHQAQAGVLPESPHKQQTFTLAQAVLQRDAELAWGVLHHPGRLRITTLDALCASLARQMPYLSRFGGQPGVAEDPEMLYEQAALETLEMLEEAAVPEIAEVVSAALAAMENDAGRLTRLLVSMLSKRDQWLRHVHRVQDQYFREEVKQGFAQLAAHDLSELLRVLPPASQTALMPCVRFAASQGGEEALPLLDWQTPLTTDMVDLSAWQALSRFLLTSAGTLRKRFDKRNGLPATPEGKSTKAALGDWLAAQPNEAALEHALLTAQGIPPVDFSESAWSTVEAFARLLQLASAQLWLVFQRQGRVDFIEIAARASLALGEDEAPTDLAQALDYRIQHLLVDEFQDTSPIQVALLAQLTRGWTVNEGRTLFLVGDPMQSIYRFRKADVGTFLTVREQGIGGLSLEKLRLCRNNRSHPPIVNWVNQVFPGVFPPEDHPASGAVRFAPAVPTRLDEAGSGVFLHPVFAETEDENGDLKAAARLAEARVILNLIEQTRQTRPEARVAILVRARSHLETLVQEIRQSAPALRFQAVEIEGLAARQHVQDLLTLQYALWHRADRVHWLALLRAPWCGLTLADLHVLAGDAASRQATVMQLMQDPARIARMSPEGQIRLQHVRDRLALALEAQGRQTPRRWLESLWLMLDGPACLHSSAELADVAAFFDLMDALTAEYGPCGLNAERLQQRAAQLYAPPDPLADERLQMMTIHKSKGLEFDVVIVPGMERVIGGQDPSLLVWDEVAGDDGQTRLLVAPMPLAAHQGDGPEVTVSHYRYLRELERTRSQHEDARLLYVAATRAIHQLHLLGGVALDDKKPLGFPEPKPDSFLGRLWSVGAQALFSEALASGEGVVGQGRSNAVSGSPPLRRLMLPSSPEALNVVSRYIPPVLAANEPLPATVVSLEIAVGTLVHRCFELFVRHGIPDALVTGETQSLEKVWGISLSQAGLASGQLPEAIALVRAALMRTVASEVGRWVLSSRHEGAVEEGWMQKNADSGVTALRIDRVFIDDVGVRWIIDYKTVRGLAEDDPDALKRAAQSHRSQLARYASVFCADGRPLKAAIFFPLQAALIEVDLSAGL